MSNKRNRRTKRDLPGQAEQTPTNLGAATGAPSAATDKSFAVKAAQITAVATIVAAVIAGMATVIATRPNEADKSKDAAGVLLGPPALTGGHHPNSNTDEGASAGKSPCRGDAEPLNSESQLKDQGKIVGSTQLFESKKCRMIWAEIRDLNISSSRAKVKIGVDIFRSEIHRASQFSSWTIPESGAKGTLPALLIAKHAGACYYAKAYVGDPRVAHISHTPRICF